MLLKIPFSDSESMRTLLYISPASDHFASIQWISSTVILRWKVNVALMMWGEVFSLSGLLKLLMGVESKWFNAQRHGLQKASLCLNTERGVLVLAALQRHSRAAHCSTLCKLNAGL